MKLNEFQERHLLKVVPNTDDSVSLLCDACSSCVEKYSFADTVTVRTVLTAQETHWQIAQIQDATTDDLKTRLSALDNQIEALTDERDEVRESLTDELAPLIDRAVHLGRAHPYATLSAFVGTDPGEDWRAWWTVARWSHRGVHLTYVDSFGEVVSETVLREAFVADPDTYAEAMRESENMALAKLDSYAENQQTELDR